MQLLNIDLLTPLKLVSKEEGALVLEALCDLDPQLIPERYGKTEPGCKRFDPTQREEVLQDWGDLVFRRKYPRMEGFVTGATGYPDRHASCYVMIDIQQANLEGLVRFVTQGSCRLQAHFASIHLLTAPEIQRGGPANTIGCYYPCIDHYMLTVTTNELKRFLPDLYWGTVLGPPYVALFGREHLLSAPVYRVEELENGSIYLQLSESPLDLERDFERVDGVRRAAKFYLNHDAFYDGRVTKYQVPKFRLAPNPAFELKVRRRGSRAVSEESLPFDFES